MIRVCSSIRFASSKDWMSTRSGSVKPCATSVSTSIWLVSMPIRPPPTDRPSYSKKTGCLVSGMMPISRPVRASSSRTSATTSSMVGTR